MSDTDHTNKSSSDDRLTDLQEQFDAWRKDSIVPPGFEAQERSVEDRLQEALKVLAIRRISLIILVTLAGMGLTQSWSDFSYFFASSEPVQVGDIRKAYLSDDPLPALQNNAFVDIDSLIPTSVFDSPSHRFFFCPLYNIIVQTAQSIPAKQAHKSYFEIEAGEGRILEEKLAFIWDLPIRIDVAGRLMEVDALPARYNRIWKAFQHEVDFRPDKPVFVLVDGETPGEFLWFLMAYVLAFGVIGFSGYGYYTAKQREQALRKEAGILV